MPVHDWTRVSDGTFHDFHYSWVLEIKRALMRGLLPKGYYVMAEQIGGDLGAPDVLTLQAARSKPEPDDSLSGTATLTESPPVVHARTTIARDSYARMQRTLVIRHTSDDRIVAMIEVLSPGNKSSRHALRSFLDKAVAALDGGIHLLLVDVHPTGPRDPNSIHGVILNEIGTEEYALNSENPLTVAAYVGGAVVVALVTHFAVGKPIPDGQLFLTRENYISVPLEATYMAAWQDVPPQYQDVLLAPPPASGNGKS
ncbi:MAG TPA: DUF4058 family protein [Gemmataceae bacterium]|nr:DUF4058 family protein [Gemmataceae bacterium]